MNRTAKIVKQSVLLAILVIVSTYVGIQIGMSKHQVVGKTLEKSGHQIILADDGPKPCALCRKDRG